MTPEQLQAIAILAPIAEQMIFQVGGQISVIMNSNMTADEMVSALEKSRSANWPDLQFQTPSATPTAPATAESSDAGASSSPASDPSSPEVVDPS